jgi:hypothetical protein
VPGASHVLPCRTERAALYQPADELLPEKVARLLAHVAQMPVPRSRRIPEYIYAAPKAFAGIELR